MESELFLPRYGVCGDKYIVTVSVTNFTAFSCPYGCDTECEVRNDGDFRFAVCCRVGESENGSLSLGT